MKEREGMNERERQRKVAQMKMATNVNADSDIRKKTLLTSGPHVRGLRDQPRRQVQQYCCLQEESYAASTWSRGGVVRYYDRCYSRKFFAALVGHPSRSPRRRRPGGAFGLRSEWQPRVLNYHSFVSLSDHSGRVVALGSHGASTSDRFLLTAVLISNFP
jgi:hypothetical protein